MHNFNMRTVVVVIFTLGVAFVNSASTDLSPPELNAEQDFSSDYHIQSVQETGQLSHCSLKNITSRIVYYTTDTANFVHHLTDRGFKLAWGLVSCVGKIDPVAVAKCVVTDVTTKLPRQIKGIIRLVFNYVNTILTNTALLVNDILSCFQLSHYRLKIGHAV